MHNSLNRIQNIFGYFTTVATALAIGIALTGLILTPIPPIKQGGLKLDNVQVVKGRPHYYSSKIEQFVHVKFDLDVDLSRLFTWNTKQIFLYVTATYPSNDPSLPPSQSIVWDAILPHPLAPSHHNTYIYPSSHKASTRKDKEGSTKSKEIVPGLLKLESQRPKYQITDPTGRLANRTDATLELNWNVQPFVGALQWVSATPREVKGESNALKGSQKGFWKYLSLRRYIPAGRGARTEAFSFPPLKDRSQAAKEMGKEGLGTARGGEGNRGKPA